MARSDDFMDASLDAMQLGVPPPLRMSFVVAAVLHDTAMLDGDDAVGVTHRGQR